MEVMPWRARAAPAAVSAAQVRRPPSRSQSWKASSPRHRPLGRPSVDRVPRIIAAAAHGEGWDVAIVGNGAEALRSWRERGADLLVLELHLRGGLDGAELFAAVCQELGGRPAAIVLSAATDAPAVSKSLDLLVVRKPFELEGLITVMRRALEAG